MPPQYEDVFFAQRLDPYLTGHIQMSREALNRLAGIAAIAFGVYAIGAVFWMIASDLRGGKGGGGPVALPVPPFWFFGVGIVAISSPWIAAGILLFKPSKAGVILSWLLMLPTLIVAGFFAVTYLGKLKEVCMGENKPVLLISLLPMLPPAILGLTFCVSFIWGRFAPARRRAIES